MSLLQTTVVILLAAIAVPALFSCSYLLLLTLLSGRGRSPRHANRRTRFDIVVPAHNEEGLIAALVKNLSQIDWPREAFRIVVVADNCTDRTALLAMQAGAQVLQRQDPALRGKGHALEFAFRDSRDAGWADAIVVVDADSEVSPNLLAACAGQLDRGAHAVQVHHGVRDPLASWRTRLMTIALGAFHRVRSRGRERLGLSCGLRGNGWCVTHALLRQVPYRAYSLAEDIEYGIELGLAGQRIHYADEAWVNAEMVSSAGAARSQRQRWEHGRFQMIRAKTVPLLGNALQRRSAVPLDLAIDLLVLPLSYVAIMVALLLLGAAALAAWQLPASPWLGIGLACGGMLAAYVLRGWQLSGIGARGLADLACAPFFVAWKVVLMLQPRAGDQWVRTRRNNR